jgi:hypothetical protein
LVIRDRVRILHAVLKTGRALLLAGLPLSAVLCLRPIPIPEFDPTNTVSEQVDSTGDPTFHSLDWYAPLWERDLKQPPIPPSPAPPSVVAVPVELAPTLLATFVETGACYAHFSDRNGRVELKSVDEDVGGYRVSAIEPGRVRLVSGERELWLEVPPKPR